MSETFCFEMHADGVQRLRGHDVAVFPLRWTPGVNLVSPLLRAGDRFWFDSLPNALEAGCELVRRERREAAAPPQPAAKSLYSLPLAQTAVREPRKAYSSAAELDREMRSLLLGLGTRDEARKAVVDRGGETETVEMSNFGGQAFPLLHERCVAPGMWGINSLGNLELKGHGVWIEIDHLGYFDVCCESPRFFGWHPDLKEARKIGLEFARRAGAGEKVETGEATFGGERLAAWAKNGRVWHTDGAAGLALAGYPVSIHWWKATKLFFVSCSAPFREAWVDDLDEAKIKALEFAQAYDQGGLDYRSKPAPDVSEAATNDLAAIFPCGAGGYWEKVTRDMLTIMHGDPALSGEKAVGTQIHELKNIDIPIVWGAETKIRFLPAGTAAEPPAVEKPPSAAALALARACAAADAPVEVTMGAARWGAVIGDR